MKLEQKLGTERNYPNVISKLAVNVTLSIIMNVYTIACKIARGDNNTIFLNVLEAFYSAYYTYFFFFANVNPLSAKFIKWSNTLKQFVGKLPTNCLSVSDHFVGLALKGLRDLKVVFNLLTRVFQ